MAKTHAIELNVRFAETDAMGVVYHARYFEYFEMARVALMTELGLPYKELVKEGYHLPVVEAHIKYRMSAKFDDRLKIEVKMEGLTGPKLILDYKVLRGKDLLCEAQTHHAFINELGQPVRPPKSFVAKIA